MCLDRANCANGVTLLIDNQRRAYVVLIPVFPGSSRITPALPLSLSVAGGVTFVR
jgi:hypothetical protein